MLSPPRKPKQDPELPDTRSSVLSGISDLNSDDLSSIALDDMSSSNPFNNINIEAEGRVIYQNECFLPPLRGGHISSLGVLTASITSTPINVPTSFATTATGQAYLAEWKHVSATTDMPPLDMPPLDMPPLDMPPLDMPLADGVNLPASLQGRKSSSTSVRIHDKDAYFIEDDLIVLSYPDAVTAPRRIKIHKREFGEMNAQGGPWTPEEITFKFKDMIGHGQKCLIHDVVIKSGSNYCKRTESVCPPCKVFKVLKQIRSNMCIDHQGGIPRMILDIATELNLLRVDYRNLQVIFEAVTASRLCHITSCLQLWDICNRDRSGYLFANKRFYGCFMHPYIDKRPKSDKPQHAGSKGLANLWHDTKIWTSGKYGIFTQHTRYNTGDKMRERSLYKQEVIDDSVEYVRTVCGEEWVNLTKKSWEELESLRSVLFSRSRVRKRKKSYEEDEE